MLTLDRQVRDWLRGHDTLDDQLIGRATHIVPSILPAEWPVEDWFKRIRGLVASSPDSVRVSVVGPGGTGRGALTAAIASRLGYRLLVVHANRSDPTEFVDLYIRAQRQALLDECAIAWSGWHAGTGVWPGIVPHFPVQFVIRESNAPMPPEPGIVDIMIEIPPTSLAARRRLWHELLPASKKWSAREMEQMVGRNQVGVGDIARVARLRVRKPDEATRVLRDVSRHRLGELAQPVECPFTLDDLIVPDRLRRTLDALIYEAQERARFWERPEARRLFPMGRGLIALLSGPPGTGKTMTAQVVAASLGMDLHRIDLSTVISRYVGQTSENIQRVLSTATQMMGVVLMFDECDALFSKRVGDVADAQDRYVNSDSAHLLQAIENYPGIALLCTNKKANIDQAFVRRLRYAIEFPRPDADDRYRIWKRVVSELAGKSHTRTIERDLRALSKGVELTGGQVKFAVLTAIFSSQRNGGKPAAKHFLDGIDRELMKEGRMLSGDERSRVNGKQR
jgi:AAA+ superfamily predicted ATPase